jgi:SAM-dependent MidA family methyltransferase
MKKKSINLDELIKEKIKEKGPISFRDYMKLCLYDKEMGYYSSEIIPIGKHGDFVTSPHANPLFGALIAVQIQEFYEILEARDFCLVEFGAGFGHLAKDILSYLKKRKFYDRLSYVIIESHEKVENVQKETLSPFGEKVRWYKDISELGRFKGCIVSNELLDAFPVNVVKKIKYMVSPSNYEELFVGLDENNNFKEIGLPLKDEELKEYVKELPDGLPEGYRTEINLGIKDWLKSINSCLEKGFLLTIDYGYTWKEYFHPSRNRGTLLSYKDQQISEDFFKNPGEQDLTAHVNFTDLSRWGEEMGLFTMGYSPQWSFLASLDFEKTFYELAGGKIDPFSPLLSGVKMLILPQGMGESHKVMIQGKGVDCSTKLKGFTLKNVKEKLEIV